MYCTLLNPYSFIHRSIHYIILHFVMFPSIILIVTYTTHYIVDLRTKITSMQIPSKKYLKSNAHFKLKALTRILSNINRSCCFAFGVISWAHYCRLPNSNAIPVHRPKIERTNSRRKRGALILYKGLINFGLNHIKTYFEV